MQVDEKYPLALPQGAILAGQYVISRVLGQGGFGITYQAADHKTGRTVAVKEFFPDTMAARTDRTTVSAFSGERGESFAYGKACFLKEAETLAQFIGNEHIVRVFSYFEENGTAYFVMEFIEGTSFDQYIKDHGGKIPYEEAEKVMLPVIDALAAVHAKGIVHRDVTPDNIYLTKDGGVKLLDFGAARYSLGDKSRSLDVVLKHGFAPKEQYTRRGRQGPYTDVYTVGASLYFAVTGRRPPDSIDRLEEDELIPPSSLVKIPQEKEDAILKAMNVQPANRYQTMGEFRQALMGAPATGAQRAGGMPQSGAQHVQGGGPQTGVQQPVQQRVFTAPQRTPKPEPMQQIHNQSIPSQPSPQAVSMPRSGFSSPQPPQRMPQPVPMQQASKQTAPQSPMPAASPNGGAQPFQSVPVSRQMSAVQPFPAQQTSMQQVPNEPKKKKWLLPAGIGAGVVVAAIIIAIVILRGESKKKPAHYESEQDVTVSSNTTVGQQPGSGSGQEEAAGFNMVGQVQGNLAGNIVNDGCLVTTSDGIACYYPGVGLVWGGNNNSSVYDATEGLICSVSVVNNIIYYVDSDGRACRVRTNGADCAYVDLLSGYNLSYFWVASEGYYFVTKEGGLYSCTFNGTISGPIALREYFAPVLYDNRIYYSPANDPQAIYCIGNGSSTPELLCRINAADLTIQVGDVTTDAKGNGIFRPFVAADGYLYAVYSESDSMYWDAILQIDLSSGDISETVISSLQEGEMTTSVNENGGYLYFSSYNSQTQASAVQRCLTSCFRSGEGTIDTLWEGDSHYVGGITLHPTEGWIAFFRINPENDHEVVTISMDGSEELAVFSSADN